MPQGQLSIERLPFKVKIEKNLYSSIGLSDTDLFSIVATRHHGVLTVPLEVEYCRRVKLGYTRQDLLPIEKHAVSSDKWRWDLLQTQGQATQNTDSPRNRNLTWSATRRAAHKLNRLRETLILGKYKILGSLSKHARVVKKDQIIWIHPSDVENFIPSSETVRHGLKRYASGSVRGGNWDNNQSPLSQYSKFQFCQARWKQNIPWNETGAFAYLLNIIEDTGIVDDCQNLIDIQDRYERLDSVFQDLQAGAKFLTRYELGLCSKADVEPGGIYIHIDRQGRPVFGGGGIHRLVMAQILDLKVVPAQLGVVHTQALPLIYQFTSPELDVADAATIARKPE